MWVPPEIKNPVVFQEPNRKKQSLFGSVNTQDGRFVYNFNTIFNAETFLEHLKQIIQYKAKNKKILLILDNARYHHAVLIQPWLEKNKRKIELLFLPPYSPELNPSELIWKVIRYSGTHNRYFPTLESLFEVLILKFEQWAQPNDELVKLCTVNYVA
jgi:transposase